MLYLEFDEGPEVQQESRNLVATHSGPGRIPDGMRKHAGVQSHGGFGELVPDSSATWRVFCFYNLNRKT